MVYAKKRVSARAVSKYELRLRRFPYLMLLPYFIIYFAFSAFPLVFTLYMSFTDWSIGVDASFVAFDNYVRLFSDSRFRLSLLNTLIFIALIVPFEVFFGLLVANALTSKLMPARNAFRLFNFLPYLMMPVAVGMIFAEIFARKTGVVNVTLSSLGIIGDNIYWTGQAWPARIMVSLVILWKYVGYTSLFFIAGITNVSTDIYEAADLDGASAPQKLFYITLPVLRPVFKFILLTTLINTFQLFDEVVMLFATGTSRTSVGGPGKAVLTPIWHLYDTAFGSVQRYGYAAAIAVATFLLIVVVTFFINGFFRRRERL